MAIPPPIVSFDGSGAPTPWQPTTLDEIGKDERFLEDAIFGQPEIMGLASVRNGIRGPYRAFRQVNLETPTGRSIIADIVFFFASGHVAVVEAKRSVNPDLRDRQVVAQLLDYATALQSLTGESSCALFGGALSGSDNWPAVVAEWFPAFEHPDDLAEAFLQRLQTGEIHLVLVCDRLPPGMVSLAASLTKQATHGFEFDVVELVPYVQQDSANDALILAPHRRLGTEIVARTAVTIEYKGTEGRPNTTVTTTSLEEIEENVRAAQSGQAGLARLWDNAEIESLVRSQADSTMLALWDFAAENSFNRQVALQNKKVNPNFGFFLPHRQVDGTVRPRMAWHCNPLRDPPAIYLYQQFIEGVIGADAAAKWHSKLRGLLGPVINAGRREQTIPLSAISPKLEGFCQLMLELRDIASTGAAKP